MQSSLEMFKKKFSSVTGYGIKLERIFLFLLSDHYHIKFKLLPLVYYCAVIKVITLQAWSFAHRKVALGEAMKDAVQKATVLLSGFFFILRIADFKCCISDISACDGVI